VSVSKIKVVIDTQLYLRAAANWKSLPAKIIFDLKSEYQLVASKAILAEVQNVLNRPALRAKFPSLTDSVVQNALSILSAAEIVEPSEVPAISRDPKDDMFLACARAAEAQYIVSEDKDLLILNPYEGIQIIDALTFLAVLQNAVSPKTDNP